MEKGLIKLFENSIKNNWNLKALTDFNGETLQYKDVARKIEKLHILMENAGIVPGDKVALCGRNCGNWCVTFLAAISYGAVIVPILHEFKPDNIHNIVNHSEARLLFTGDYVWENLNEEEMPHLEGVICVNDFSLLTSRSEKLSFAREHLNELFGKKFPNRFTPDMISYKELHIRNHRILQRCDAPLPQHPVKHHLLQGYHRSQAGRQYCIHAAHGSCFRTGV